MMFAIEDTLANAILAYLQSKRFSEVHGFVAALMQLKKIEPINDKPQGSPPNEIR